MNYYSSSTASNVQDEDDTTTASVALPFRLSYRKWYATWVDDDYGEQLREELRLALVKRERSRAWQEAPRRMSPACQKPMMLIAPPLQIKVDWTGKNFKKK